MQEDMHELVLRVYDTVAEPEKWVQVLDRLTEAVDAKGCIIFGWDHGLEKPRLVAPHHSSYYERDVLEGYIARYWREEERDQAIFKQHAQRADGVDLIDDSVLARDEAALDALGNIKAMQRFGIRNRSISLLNKDDTSQSRFSIQLGADRGRLHPDERRWLTALLPHLAKALDLGRPVQRLAQCHGRLLAAMDKLKIGLCVLDGAGRIVASNTEFARQAEAYRVFDAREGERLTLGEGRSSARLEQLASDALAHGRFGARPRKEAIQLEAGHHLCVEVVPLDHARDLSDRRFGGSLVFSTDTSRGLQVDGVLVQRAFGLTSAEAELADYLARGLTNAQIAEARGRSIDTINAQVKSILSKTDCANRTQLVRVLMSFGANYL